MKELNAEFKAETKAGTIVRYHDFLQRQKNGDAGGDRTAALEQRPLFSRTASSLNYRVY
jgi:hypothetical protein